MTKLEKGCVQVYTGNGKGKSTAAFGLALRAAGRGLRVKIIQFMKTASDYGEQVAFQQWLPQIECCAYGSGQWVKKGQGSPVDYAQAAAAMLVAKEALDGDYDLVILDEINNACFFQLLEPQAVVDLLVQRQPWVEVVLTGRNAPEEILAMADLVTEMQEVKHPYYQGVSARPGIEY